MQRRNPMVLAGLRPLHNLETLELLTTDVCSVEGLESHPSLTSLTIGGETWGDDDDDDDDDVDEEGIGMPDLSGIGNIPNLTYLDLSVGLSMGSKTSGFKVTPHDYCCIGACKALTTLEIPICSEDDALLYQLTRCPRLEKIVLYAGRGWDDYDGDTVSHGFLCKCPALKSVRSTICWMDCDERSFFRSLAKKLARSHPGILVALPRSANDYPTSDHEQPVEEFLEWKSEDEEDKEF